MIFTDLVYLPFLVASAVLYRVLPGRFRPWWLALTGAAFYAYYAPAALPLIVAIALTTFLLARRAETSRWALVAGVLVPLASLAYFKYVQPALSGASGAGAGSASAMPGILGAGMPLAISFFTFEFVHYVADSRSGGIRGARLRDFLAFAMFFPTLVAGPIKRFEAFEDQVEGRPLTPDDVWTGLWRIVVGAFRKLVIADSLAPLVVPLTEGRPGHVGPAALAVALVAYSLRIYFDFSGYSHIAIGSARLFGIRVPENFDRPYLARDIGAFWRRWHMSLTSWITDYVYKPLGGNRRGLARTLANLVIAMLVSGAWHGAGLNFVLWGLYHGILLAGHRAWRTLVTPRILRRVAASSGRAAAAWERTAWLRAAGSTALTFSLVTLGWGLFVLPAGRFLALVAQAWGR